MSALLFIVFSLATYRLTVLVSRDAGPFRMFARLRKSRLIGQAVSCPYCVSVWMSFLVNLSYYLACERTPPVVFAGLVFAMSGITIVLDRCFTIDHKVELE